MSRAVVDRVAQAALLLWLELNEVGVWLCDWQVLEVVVEGAVGDVGGEGREGVLQDERTGAGGIVPGGVPYALYGTRGWGRRGHVDGRDSPGARPGA